MDVHTLVCCVPQALLSKCCVVLQVGFTDPRVLEASPIEVHDPQLRELLGDAAFYSATFRWVQTALWGRVCSQKCAVTSCRAICRSCQSPLPVAQPLRDPIDELQLSGRQWLHAMQTSLSNCCHMLLLPLPLSLLWLPSPGCSSCRVSLSLLLKRTMARQSLTAAACLEHPRRTH